MPLKFKQLSPALAMAALLVAAPAASPASADTTASLPQLTGFHQILVDEAAGYVFLSEGVDSYALANGATSTGPLIVTDLAGNYLATVDDGDGVEGMALSRDGKTLAVALAAKQEIDGIDVSTITQPTPVYTVISMTGQTPVDVTGSYPQVWVSYNYNITPYGTAGAVAGFTPSYTVLPAPSSGWISAPEIATDPAGSGVLVAAQPGLSGARAASYYLSGYGLTGPTPTSAQTSALGSCQYLNDLAVVPVFSGGVVTSGIAHFITACGAPNAYTVYNAADLSVLNSHPNSYVGSPDAVTTAADGTIAAGAGSTSGSSVNIYNSSENLLNTLTFPGDLAARGLALSADASRLYAVVKNGSSYSLDVFDNPKLDRSMLTLHAPGKVAIGKTYTVSGNLSLAAGTPPAGTPVQITATKPGTSARHWTAQTAANGTLALSDKPPAAGTYTYTATYAGTSTTTSATATATVTVTKLPVSLGITTSAGNVNYDAAVKVTARLGATYANRTVAIYASTVGSSKKVLLKRGSVSSSGYLTVKHQAPHSTVYSAVFTGDARYQARTVTRTVGVRARVDTKYTGYYATSQAGGHAYHLYHHTARLNAAITVTPDKHGQCVRLQTQEFRSGSWHASTTTGCSYLSKYSKVSSYLTLGQADQGHSYRVRVDYVRESSDQSNLSTQSSWFYFAVRK